MTHLHDAIRTYNMLVLSRREGERIMLGDSIVVTVVKVAGDRVRLGIEAPSDVLVLRGELEQRRLTAERQSIPGPGPASAHPKRGAA
jgi:carbon storage regulator